jgi:hypothetical protein
MGPFAPEALLNWTVDCLPDAARLWVRLYGRRSVLASHPGSKLYLLLEKELEASGVPAKRSVRKSLLPSRLPPAITYAEPNESMVMRIRRYRSEIYFIYSRLRFHVIEGLRYLGEGLRWRRHRSEFAS